jgi:tRNA threonylcarbamoyladenosine biosynthesis protein TsaE
MGAEALYLRRWLSRSAATTEELGERLGALLAPGDVLALDGELGAGKTTLVRGLARGLGVSEPVSSPSFTLMNAYAGRLPVYHLDAWMAERGDAFLAEGGAEWLASNGVALVEWAERVERWLPAGSLRVRLEHAGPPGPQDAGRRRILLELASGAGSLAERLERLEPPPGLERLG